MKLEVIYKDIVARNLAITLIELCNLTYRDYPQEEVLRVYFNVADEVKIVCAKSFIDDHLLKVHCRIYKD